MIGGVWREGGSNIYLLLVNGVFTRHPADDRINVLQRIAIMERPEMFYDDISITSSRANCGRRCNTRRRHRTQKQRTECQSRPRREDPRHMSLIQDRRR